MLMLMVEIKSSQLDVVPQFKLREKLIKCGECLYDVIRVGGLVPQAMVTDNTAQVIQVAGQCFGQGSHTRTLHFTVEYT
jgi:hypothetical protein